MLMHDFQLEFNLKYILNLNRHKSILVSEPATYSLVNYALAHGEIVIFNLNLIEKTFNLKLNH